MKILLILMSVVGAVAMSWLEVSAQQTKSQWDGVYSAEQAKRGDPLFAEKCASCHGPDLKGTERAPTLIGAEFATNWDDLSLGDLFEKIRISMPQGAGDSLTRQQYADLVACILQKGEYPAGPAELPSETAQLNTFKFLAKKP